MNLLLCKTHNRTVKGLDRKRPEHLKIGYLTCLLHSTPPVVETDNRTDWSEGSDQTDQLVRSKTDWNGKC